MAENDTRQLINRFAELARRADDTGFPQTTKFLNLAEQTELLKLRLPVPFMLIGGYPNAERNIAVFGAEAGEDLSPPIVCIKISPVSKRFADELTHRDFLGALMAQGVTREMLGDIIVAENCGWLFCLDSIAEHIIESLTEVKRTSVRCAYSEPPETLFMEPEPASFVIPSERLDAVISAVYRIPREEAKLTVEKELVYIDGRLAIKPAAQLKEGSLVTVRGRGRFKFLGIERETKKGKLRVEIIKY